MKKTLLLTVVVSAVVSITVLSILFLLKTRGEADGISVVSITFITCSDDSLLHPKHLYPNFQKTRIAGRKEREWISVQVMKRLGIIDFDMMSELIYLYEIGILNPGISVDLTNGYRARWVEEGDTLSDFVYDVNGWVAPYVCEIEADRQNLGDPNLIYPDQILMMRPGDIR